MGGAFKTVRTAVIPNILCILSLPSSFQLLEQSGEISRPSLIWNIGTENLAAGSERDCPGDGSVDHRNTPASARPQLGNPAARGRRRAPGLREGSGTAGRH